MFSGQQEVSKYKRNQKDHITDIKGFFKSQLDRPPF